MRTVMVIRHARSTANQPATPTTMTAQELAFANRTAPLIEKGRQQCKLFAPTLLPTHRIYPFVTRLAVSEFVRAQQTARLLGFRESLTTPYHALNEVDHGMDIRVLRAMLARNEIPPIALSAAQTALDNAPRENVWVTHGLLIAGLCTLRRTVKQYAQAVPAYCEVRYLRL